MVKVKKKKSSDPVRDQDLIDRIVWAANDILWLWRRLVHEAESQTLVSASWYKHDVRQAYQDAINSLRHNGVIETYDVEDCQVKIGGVWRNDRRAVKFTQTGAAVPVD